MNKLPVLLILPILAVIFVSGCVTAPAGVAGPGVVVLDFRPDLPSVYSEDRVKLQLRAQNQGEVRAERVEAELTGIDVSEWEAFVTAQKTLGSLLPFDEVTETPGEVKTVSWDLRAPMLARGAQFTYSPIVKLSYDYRTTAQKPITLVSEAELRRIQQEGRTLPSKPSTYSSGPLAVEIRTGEYVRTSDEFGAAYDIFPVYVRITNTGWTSGGTVVPDSFASGYGYDYPLELTITPPSGTSFRYTGFFSDTNCGTSVPLELFQGQEAEVTCELEVMSPPAFQEERLITATVDYRYQTEATASVTVTGRERF